MTKNKLYIFVLVLIVSFSSCTKKTSHTEQSQLIDTLKLNYAKGFEVQYLDKYKKVIVKNPWHKKNPLATYYLVANDKLETPSDGQKIVVPIHSLASSSVTHLEFLQLLNEIETLKGFCNPKLAYNESVRDRFLEEKIVDLGDALKLNIEQLVALQPEAMILTAYNQNDPNAERIQKFGIPVIYNNEWMEEHILGRAEWIKFVSLFFDKENVADSIFSETEKEYNRLKKIALESQEHPTIMSGNNFRGTWYMPGGNSFMSQIFQDAQADYFYSSDTISGSLPLSLEVVLKNFSEVDCWLGCNFNSYDELLSADKKHEIFNPVKQQKVYNFNKRLLASGANDYWESAIAHPDYLLADFITILHPQLLPDWKLYYTQPLKK